MKFANFSKYLSEIKTPLKELYETKIIPPIKRKRILKSARHHRTVFELYKESKLPFNERPTYLKKKLLLANILMKKMKIKEKNAIEIYRKREQIIIPTLKNRENNYCDGWYCFQPLDKNSSDIEKYIFKNKNDYENFLNDKDYKYPCCLEFSNISKNAEIFRKRIPGNTGNKVIDRFYNTQGLLDQPEYFQFSNNKN